MTLRTFTLSAAVALNFLACNRGTLQAQTQPPVPPAYNPTNPLSSTAGEPPSVEVAPDYRVTFRIHAPEATAVTLNGDFLLGAPRR